MEKRYDSLLVLYILAGNETKYEYIWPLTSFSLTAMQSSHHNIIKIKIKKYYNHLTNKNTTMYMQ